MSFLKTSELKPGGFLVLKHFMNQKQELGKKGEFIVKNHYLNLGYELLEESWRSGRREVDLIFSKNQKLIFIEVKSRNFNPFDFKEVPLSKKQVIGLKQAILSYCFLNKVSPEKASLDLVLVTFKRTSKGVLIKKYHNICR